MADNEEQVGKEIAFYLIPFKLFEQSVNMLSPSSICIFEDVTSVDKLHLIAVTRENSNWLTSMVVTRNDLSVIKRIEDFEY